MTFTMNYMYNGETHKPMRIKNCMSELHAKVRLAEYLESKHGKGELVVINCMDSNIGGGFFNEIFKDGI